jgi:hypothetical protein
MLALERVFSVLIKLQTLMLSFTFELFIEISFRYLSLSYGVFCKVGVSLALIKSRVNVWILIKQS